MDLSLPFIAILGAFCVLIWQVRQIRILRSIDLLLRLENDFFGPAKKLQRIKAARGLLTGEAEPILDFFETVALLVRRKALDEEMVRHTFFYWMDRYYAATADAIATRKTVDPLVWKDLTMLVAKMRKSIFDSHTASYTPPSPKEVTRFLKEELTEAT